MSRARAEVERELAHVRWLLAEMPRWGDVVPGAQQALLRQRYGAQERALVSALAESEPPGSPATDSVVTSPGQLEADAPVAAEVPPPEALPERQAPVAEVAPSVAAPLPSPPREPRGSPPRPQVVVRSGPSAWERLWKPVLGESVGWFIGAFLILAGTFTFVADAWASMSSTNRALTVFGLAVFWTLGFAGWAHMLSRRETTRPASRVLWRIAAAVAPLATVALGPLVGVPLIAWPLLLGQAVFAGGLASRVAKEAWSDCADPARQREEVWALALALGGATLVLGAAPVLAHGAWAWLELVPVVLLGLVVWRNGPAPASRAAVFSLSAMGYAVVLFAARLHIAAVAGGGQDLWGVHAVALSAFALVALELVGPRARPGAAGEVKAADGLAVLVVAAQTVVLWPAFFAEAPSFVFAALLATLTTARLARRAGPASALAARWLVPAYVFGYVSFQRVDQLVPPVVVEWYGLLKAALGYSTAPLPPSYASVYAAVYVVAVGLVAGRKAAASDPGARARADMLLRCTAWGALAFGALALVSIADDARPALLALPTLTLATLGLAAWTGRAELTRSSAALSVATGVALFAATHLAWPIAAVALFAALVSVPGLRVAREAHSASTMLLVALSIGAAFSGGSAASAGLTLGLASAAALLVARNLDDARLLSVALFVPMLLVARVGESWMLSLAALGAVVGLPRASGPSRRLAFFPAAVAAAVAGPLWETLDAHDWPTVSLALGGVGLTWAWVTVRARWSSRWLDALAGGGLLFLVAALAPLSQRFSFYQPWQAQALAGLVALGASVHAVRRGRTWQGVWLASLLVLLALGCVGLPGEWRPSLLEAAGVVLLATPALWPVVTVPLASLLLGAAFFSLPGALVVTATALSVIALLGEWEWTARFVLNRSSVAWVASVCAAMLLALGVAEHRGSWLVAAVVLPLFWARGTRHVAMLVLGLALSAAVGLVDAHSSALVLLVAPAVSVVFGRLLLGTVRGLGLLGLPGGTSRVPLLVVGIAAGVATGLTRASLPGAVAWVVAIVSVGALPAVSLLGAAVVAAVVPPLELPVAWALMALSPLVRRFPRAVQEVLGWKGREGAVLSASLGAVALAALASVRLGGPWVSATLPVALLEAGGLMSWWWPWAAAVFSAGVDLHSWQVAPWGPVVATVAGAVAVVLRWDSLASSSRRVLEPLGIRFTEPLSLPWWWGSAALVLVSLSEPSEWWLVSAAVLLVTPVPLELAVGTALGGLVLIVLGPREHAGLTLAVVGAAMSWLGAWRSGREPVARTWLHAGWVASVVAVAVVGVEVRTPAVPMVWVLAAVTSWSVVFRWPWLEWLGWAASWVASHVLVVHVGAVLSRGAPPALVLPYFALATSLLALIASWRAGGQSRAVGLALGSVGLLELSVAVSLLSGPYGVETGVAALAGVVLLGGAARRALRHDDGVAAWLAQAVVVVTVLASRRMGAGASPGLFEAWAGMVWGSLVWGLALFLGREERPQVAKALRGGAVAWPLVALVAAPWSKAEPMVLLLLVAAGHYGWLARTGLRRVGASVSAMAFNAGMVAAFFASGWHGAVDLALPVGLSVLALTATFRAELGRDVQVKLRAVAMTAVYAAASWRPLTFSTAWGLFFSVVVCVLGVGVGAALRIRSFVLIGTAFLVTSVVATLVRQGLAEPRFGAILLAVLGLAVVAFMVGLTTRRAELVARLTALRSAMSRWEG